jgi:uncharacterized protein (DUF1499 family)
MELNMIFSGKRPQHLGVKDGHLTHCPAKPNCVSSQSEPHKRAYIAPLAFKGDPDAAMRSLNDKIMSLAGATLVTATKDYLHVEFKSKRLGFIDDFEIVLDQRSKQFHVRSASRLGHSDFGVNRRRVERIRVLMGA